jgi:hypothetical protein
MPSFMREMRKGSLTGNAQFFKPSIDGEVAERLKAAVC